jgi:hypothetical protein
MFYDKNNLTEHINAEHLNMKPSYVLTKDVMQYFHTRVHCSNI